jgi:RNA polymerase sigma-70 factor (ECF subfamily)
VADDAVAEVMRRLLQNGVPTDVPDDKWEAYLVQAALNAAKDEIKKMSRRRDRPDFVDDIRATRADQPDSTNVEEDVAEAIDRERTLDRVHAELAKLPTPQRQVVVGRHLEGRTNEQLASDLGVTPARVSQLHKAGIRTLAVLLAGDSP